MAILVDSRGRAEVEAVEEETIFLVEGGVQITTIPSGVRLLIMTIPNGVQILMTMMA